MAFCQAERWHAKVMAGGRRDDMMGNTDTSEYWGQSVHAASEHMEPWLKIYVEELVWDAEDAPGVWDRVGVRGSYYCWVHSRHNLSGEQTANIYQKEKCTSPLTQQLHI